MNAHLHNTFTDLSGAQPAITLPATKPAKRVRDYSTQSKAMKMAWASYRNWEASWIKDFNEPVGRFARFQFNKYLRDAYQTLRIEAMGAITITREQSSFIGSDSQYSDRRGL